MKVQKENVGIDKIAVGDEITTEACIPLMPALYPENGAEALLKIVYLDKDVVFVVKRIDFKQQIPWFFVQIISSYSDSFGDVGWINSLALLRKDDEENKNNKNNEETKKTNKEVKEVKETEKNNKEGKIKSLQQLLEKIGLNPLWKDNQTLGR